MPRATQHVPSSDRKPGRVVDTLILPFAQRQAQRGFLFGVKGTCVELDFPEPVSLRTDDALLLDDGGVVEIVAEAEPLFEVRFDDPAALARLAWHFGDSHIPVEIQKNRMRLRRDPALEETMQAFGSKVKTIEAPFEPEGSYAVPGDGHHHDHDHHHHHDHAHGHAHDHGHPHGQDHDHDHKHEHDHDHTHHHDHDHGHKRG